MISYRKINCIAIDDEPISLAIIQKYIAAVPHLHLISTCTNAIDALSVMRTENIELLFLDIQMPYITGTNFIRSLPHPPQVIFTTAYRKYAVECFDLDAVDFLLKPVSFERFLKAVNKVIKSQSDYQIIEHSKPASSEGNFICVRAERKNVKLNLSDILFIESLQDYCKVVTKEKTILTKQTLSTLAQNLPPKFIRIHRSYIVSLDKIESYTTELVQIQQHQLPVSRSYRHEVETALDTP